MTSLPSRQLKDLTGMRFGRLTVIAFSHRGERGKAWWRCRCDCGTERVISRMNLTRRLNPTQSCGCYRADHVRAAVWQHGGYRAPEYLNWRSMLKRCERVKNHNYKDYGGRGIRVCERWHDFNNFLADMGPRPSPRHTIDRIDRDGHYERGNCRWATPTTQARNRKSSLRLTYNGSTKLLREWADELHLHYHTVRNRLYRGWSPDRILTTPTPHKSG